MTGSLSVFEETYTRYLEQLKTVDLASVPEKLGAAVDGETIRIPLFGIPYAVSRSGITDPSGKRPSLDVCVVLCKYLLLRPPFPPKGKDWAAYRDMKDTGPLTVFWAHDVERAILKHFAGNPERLAQAGRAMGGYPPQMVMNHDVAMQFDGLPKVPVLMLFNDGDDEFPARCSVLFERRAEKYLDPESLAMLGSLLAGSLKKADRRPAHAR
jgi:hypothetical protein